MAILQEHTVGDPMNEQVKWTNLSLEAIKTRLKEAGIAVSRNIVRKLLKKHDYVKRKVLKKKAASGHVNRNAQFERIKAPRQDYETAGNPIISKGTIGQPLSRGSTVYSYNSRTVRLSECHFTVNVDGGWR
jgi:hypothetical protein